MPMQQDQNHVLAQHNGQALRVTTLVPAAPTTRIVDERQGATDGVGQWRVEIDTSGAAQSYFLHVLAPRDGGEADLLSQVVDSGSSYTITLMHPTKGAATIVLQKGMTSSGGTIQVSSSQCMTQGLTSAIQDIAVTDDGPHWGP